MRTVKEVSEIAGISIRTLRYYDEIELLKPTQLTEAGYRLYDNKALERLQQIMFFKELEMSLSNIKWIMDNPNYSKAEVLSTQKALLERKRNRLNGIIELIADVMKGANTMSFGAFNDDDLTKIVDHSIEVTDKEILIEKFGSLEKYREFLTQELKKDEKANAHFIKIYGNKDKAIEACLQGTGDKEKLKEQKNENDRIYKQFALAMKTNNDDLAREAVEKLAENFKIFFRLDNARCMLLDMAKGYLNHAHPELQGGTEKQYGIGITKYIGQAIQQYYGV